MINKPILEKNHELRDVEVVASQSYLMLASKKKTT